MSDVSLKNIMINYKKWDENTAIVATQNISQILGGRDSTQKLVAPEDEILRRIDLESLPGHSKDQLAEIENLFKNKINEYLEDTQNIIILNDLANVNNFANTSVKKETNRLSTLKERSSSDLIKSKQNFLRERYAIEYSQFKLSVLQFSFSILIIVSLVTYAFIVSGLDSTIFWILMSVIAFVYIVIVVFAVKSLQSRRKDDWNKFYFLKSS